MPTTAQKTAFARYGQAYESNVGLVPATFMFSDAACTKRLGWQAGLLAEGDRWDEFTVVLALDKWLAAGGSAKRVAA